MTYKHGDENPELKKAIRRIVHAGTINVEFADPHAYDAMEDDDFDQEDVMTCLRRGTAYGPEIQNGQLRCNVIHQGIHINVVVGGLDNVKSEWSALQNITVVTVMRTLT